MDWEALGAIGELVGALAVIFTLIFLIFQIRQNTIALQQQSARDSTTSLHQTSIAMMHADVANAVSKAYSEADAALTIGEHAQLEHFMLGYMLVFQQDFLDWEKGLHITTTWESRIPIIKGLFSAQWSRKWWQNMGREYVTPQFRKVIDEILANEAAGAGNYWEAFSEKETQ